jgi:hypothetical protein
MALVRGEREGKPENSEFGSSMRNSFKLGKDRRPWSDCEGCMDSFFLNTNNHMPVLLLELYLWLIRQ